MKNFIILFTLFLAAAACSSESTLEEAETLAAGMTTPPSMEQAGKLRHVVMFKFKEDASKADIKKVEDAFTALPGKIDAISAYEWGTNNSPEGLDKGFTHCFFLTFDSEEDRAEYLPHPDHKAFGGLIGPYIEDVMVLDYWAK